MAEKKHKPTPKRLRDARKRGEVVRSRELSSVGAFMALWIFLGFGGHHLSGHLNHIIEQAATAADPATASAAELWWPRVRSALHDMGWILAPLLALSVSCALLLGGVQTRGMVSAVPLVPKFERLNPARALQNLLSMRQLLELGKLLLKALLLVGVLVYFLSLALPSLLQWVYVPVPDLARLSGSVVWRLMGWMLLVYLIGAALDYAHQFHEFMKQQKMSIEELRRDLREREGDPIIKGRRRVIAQEWAFSEQLAVASVVVVNPTHVSVALQYAPGKTPLPRVIVKGLDATALQIRTEAERKGIPVLENPPLARKLFREVALDHYINEDLIDVVAAVFRWAAQVDRRPVQSVSRSPTKNPTPRTV